MFYAKIANCIRSLLVETFREDEELGAILSWTATGELREPLQFKPIKPPRDWGISFILPKLGKGGLLQRLADALASSDALPVEVAQVEAEGIYLNFYFEPNRATAVLQSCILSAEKRGSLAYFVRENLDELRPALPTVMIEFSQPNTHKEFHVGHLRNVLIGDALSNLYSFLGYPVVRANYYGDHGIHVAKTLWGFIKLHGGSMPLNEEPVQFLARVYAEAEKATRDAEGTEEGIEIERQQLEILSQIGDEHSDMHRLWLDTREIFLKEFNRIYGELGVHFDVEFYESEVEERGKLIVDELVNKGVAKRETKGEYAGTVFVDFADLGAPKLGKMVLIRSDGTSLYQTKELALAKEKFTKKFPTTRGERAVDVSLYVVGSEQKLYFQQLFKILSAWGFLQAKDCKHIAYELVQLASGKMSSREGTVIAYRDFINEAITRAKQITDERGISADKEYVARLVALGALKYAFLKVGTEKTIVFDWDTALSFDGNAGPYIQYAYARALKLVLDFQPPTLGVDTILPEDYVLAPEEVLLSRVLAEFPDAVNKAHTETSLNLICNHLYDLTRAFTVFYDACPVLSADEPIRSFRRSLVHCFLLAVRASASDILGIELPEEM